MATSQTVRKLIWNFIAFVRNETWLTYWLQIKRLHQNHVLNNILMKLESTKLSLSIIKGRHFSQFAWIDSFHVTEAFMNENRSGKKINLFNWKICPSGLLWYRIFQIVFFSNLPTESGNDKSWKFIWKEKPRSEELLWTHHRYSILYIYDTLHHHASNLICVKWIFLKTDEKRDKKKLETKLASRVEGKGEKKHYKATVVQFMFTFLLYHCFDVVRFSFEALYLYSIEKNNFTSC